MNVNRVIASCGQEVKIHDLSSGTTLCSHAARIVPTNIFTHISWSTSGKQLLGISTESRPTVLKRADKEKESFTLNSLNDIQYPSVGVFSKNSEDVVTFGSGHGEVYSINVCTKSLEKSFPTLPSQVMLMDYADHDIMLAAGCKSGKIFLFNAKGDVCSSFFVPWSHSVSSLIFHPCRDQYLVAASREGVVAVWDITSHSTKFVARDHTKTVTGVAISVSEELLATVGRDRKIHIYDLRTKDTVFNTTFSSELTAVACSFKDQEFAVGTSCGRIFFVDKRQPDYTTGSISAQKGSVRAIRYCNDLSEKESLKIRKSNCDSIFVDTLSSTSQLISFGSPLKSQASGDFSTLLNKSMLPRIPGGMDDGIDNHAEICKRENPENPGEWVEKISDQVGDTQVPFLQVVEEANLNRMKHELIRTNKDIVHSFMEEINAQFLKIRMGVSREFCRIEQNNNRRWQDFNATLLKVAGCEDAAAKEQESPADSVTNDSLPTVASKAESLYTTKTRMGHYSVEN